ncbi:MAG: PIN domain-containing protein [Candidatus Sulfotelmatobacter sp.]
MVVIDSTFLSLMLHPKARPPRDPSTQKPVERIEDRIEKLTEDLDSESERMIVPTPVLSEFLVLAGSDAPEYLNRLGEKKNLLVKPFDEKAAIAAIELEDRKQTSKRGPSSSPWTKVRFDRQIVAIAKTNGAKRIYSDDEDLMKYAARAGIEVVRTWDLPLPAAKQINIDYKRDE